ncbi:hypothetical protein, partial [Campylobacter sp. RM16191]|uniref:hypothetical protein n=1 Tax=Campylobacter sp. RM16191 TaxID=1705728 RepID=UPI0014743548
IDDTKVSDVSTWSSSELKRRFDLKADEATAYKEWNYKKISEDYTAKNNDAIYVDANKAITITLPSSGKVKIMDFKGSFSEHNVTVIAGEKKFTFNVDFQKAEMVFFDGEWRIANGELYEILQYPFGTQTTLSFGLGSGVQIYNIDNTIVAYDLAGNIRLYDSHSGANIPLSMPAPPSGYTLKGSQKVNNCVMSVYASGHNIIVYKLDVANRVFTQISLSSSYLQYSNVSVLSGAINCSRLLVKVKYDTYSYVYAISESGGVTRLNSPIGGSAMARNDILYTDKGQDSKYINVVTNVATPAPSSTITALGEIGGKIRKCRIQEINGELEARSDGVYIKQAEYINGVKTVTSKKLDGVTADIYQTYNFLLENTIRFGIYEVVCWGQYQNSQNVIAIAITQKTTTRRV